MSLRDQLREILPQILPANPAEAVKGTDLIRFVRLRLGDQYSDATLRYHFSILSYDSTSPIAKVNQGQGYFLRTEKADPQSGDLSQALFGGHTEAADVTRSRYERFRAIMARFALDSDRYPFALSSPTGRDWELPDLVITDWDFDTDLDGAPQLDTAMMNLKRHLGVATVNLSAAHLRLSMTLDSCNADFFQAVSTTRWANHGEILIAEPVNDEALVAILRTLGHQYGIGITSCGLELSLIDELPSAEEIRNFTGTAFDSMQTLLKMQRISVGSHRTHVDWQHVALLKKKHQGIGRMIDWINECLETKKPYWAKPEGQLPKAAKGQFELRKG
jgi:hypothetical protein